MFKVTGRAGALAAALAFAAAPAVYAQARAEQVWEADDGGIVVLKPNGAAEIAITHETTGRALFLQGRVIKTEPGTDGGSTVTIRAADGATFTLRTAGDAAELTDGQGRKAATLKR